MSFELTNQVPSTTFQIAIHRCRVLDHKTRVPFELVEASAKILRLYAAMWLIVLMTLMFCWLTMQYYRMLLDPLLAFENPTQPVIL